MVDVPALPGDILIPVFNVSKAVVGSKYNDREVIDIVWLEKGGDRVLVVNVDGVDRLTDLDDKVLCGDVVRMESLTEGVVDTSDDDVLCDAGGDEVVGILVGINVDSSSKLMVICGMVQIPLVAVAVVLIPFSFPSLLKVPTTASSLAASGIPV